MNIKLVFSDFLTNRGIERTRIEFAVGVIQELYLFCRDKNMASETCDIEILKQFCSDRITGLDQAKERIIALIWYCGFMHIESGIIYFLTLLGSEGIFSSIADRTQEILGESIARTVFSGFQIPPLGTLSETLPDSTKHLLHCFEKNLSRQPIELILAGNHHRIPLEFFDEDKKKFHELNDIDNFLKYRHEKMIGEMETCLARNKLWYEQRITGRVLDFVKSNPEIQSGVRQGNTIFVTKIPYNPEAYLLEEDPVLKRFHACHCGLARASIARNNDPVPAIWCNCSAGFEKLIFDVVFEKPVPVHVIESVLQGDLRCRFALSIS